MKQSRTAFTYAIALALGTGAYAAIAQVHTPPSTVSDVPRAVHGVPLTWVPDWLMKPLSRAIADATDPRDRKSGTQ